MAITVHSTPSGYPSAHQELWHVVESTNKSTAGFKYIFDIYKDANLLARVRNSPYGDDKLGILDVHNIVRSTFDSEVGLLAVNDEILEEYGEDIFWVDYDVRYGEISGGVLTANIASGTYRAYNNYERGKYDNAQSEITGAAILTNRPTNSNLYSGDVIMIPYFPLSGQTFRRRIYLDNVLYSNTSQAADENARVYSFEEEYFSNYKELKFELSGSVDGIIGSRTFKKKCSKYEIHVLVFLNAYGLFESFTFVHGKKMLDNQKKKFQRLPWRFATNTALDITSDTYLESNKVYASEHTMKMQLTSDILTTDEYNWLAELVNSPCVYYYDLNDKKYIPAIITDTNYEFKDDRINKTDTLIVNIEFSEKINTQFR